MKHVSHAKGPYSAIVYINGGDVIAENQTGGTIAKGEAGLNDASIAQSAIDHVQHGSILLAAGTRFHWTAPLHVETDGIALVGGNYGADNGGKGATVIDLSACSSFPALHVNPHAQTYEDRILNFSADNMAFFDCAGTAIKLNRLNSPRLNNISGENCHTLLHVYNLWEGFFTNLRSLYCGKIASSSPTYKIEGGADVANATNHIQINGLAGGAGEYRHLESSGIVNRSSMDNVSLEFHDDEIGLYFNPNSAWYIVNVDTLYGINAVYNNGGTVRIVNGSFECKDIVDHSIYSAQHSHLALHCCSFSGASREALVYADQSYLDITGCQFNNGKRGIFIQNPYHAEVVGKFYDQTHAAILAQYFNDYGNLNIHDCYISGVAASGENPIYTSVAKNLAVHDNMIYNSGRTYHAIRLYGGTRLSFNRNNLVGNFAGLYVDEERTAKWAFGNFGSSIGTGVEQVIPHGLMSAPTDASIYIPLTGEKQGVISDATNIYVRVNSGVIYRWKVEA